MSNFENTPNDEKTYKSENQLINSNDDEDYDGMSPSTKKFVYGIVLLVIVGIAGYFAASNLIFTPEYHAYKLAQKADSIERFRNYIAEFPQGKHLSAIQARIDELDELSFQETTKLNSLDALDKYAANFPTGKHIAEINDKVIAMLKPEMILVEGGTYKMGNDKNESDDNMAHQVAVNSYKIDKYEVTQAEYQKVMDNNPSAIKSSSYPVTNVSWQNATDYAAKVGKRLPSEAEWEFATKGGRKTGGFKFSGSNEPEDVAWFNKTSGGSIHRVGTKKPNELGLYDMSGNVAEWANDWYAAFDAGMMINPKGPQKSSFKVIRGGAWAESKKYISTTFRVYNKNIPEGLNKNTGFRCASDAK